MARYIAYSIDGGLLQSKFTLAKMIKMMEHVTNDNGENQQVLQDEIQYMLNIRKRGRAYERHATATLAKQLQDITNSFQHFEMNLKVLVVLIET